MALPFVTGSDLRIFRCGKCPNCLKHRSSEMKVRVIREVQDKPCAFLTFTYKDQFLPLQVNDLKVSPDTGEIVFSRSRLIDSRNQSSSAIALRDHFFKDAPFEIKWRFDKKVNRMVPVKRYSPLYEDSESLEFFEMQNNAYRRKAMEIVPCDVINRREIYFTLDYEDIKRTFKKFRMKCPDVSMSVYIVPEYGGCGYRPHFHAIVIGLSCEDCQKLADCWYYGRSNGKKNPAVSLGDVRCDFVDAKDSVSVQKISSYLAKYATKGNYDCPYIRSGNCSRPRCGISQGFGLGTIEDLKRLASQVLRWDLYGVYDPKTLSDDQLEKIDPYALASHRVIWLNDHPYPVPRYLYQKIIGKKTLSIQIDHINEYQKNRPFNYVACSPSYSYRATSLQSKVARCLSLRALADVVQECKEFEAFLSSCRCPIEAVRSSCQSEKMALISSEFAFVYSLEDTPF